MSKAFTKEENHENEEDLEIDPTSSLPGFKNYITQAGAEKLKAELKTLLNSTRPEVVKTVSWAASNGDRSENGDYIYGKRRLREIDRRIRFLSKRLESAEVVDVSKIPETEDKILFGARVKYQNEDGLEKTIQIVGIDEANPSEGKVSWISPIAKAFLGLKRGDTALLKTPNGEQDLEIVKIWYSTA